MQTAYRRLPDVPGCWADACHGGDCTGCADSERERHRACDARPAHPLGLCAGHLATMRSTAPAADAA